MGRGRLRAAATAVVVSAAVPLWPTPAGATVSPAPRSAVTASPAPTSPASVGAPCPRVVPKPAPKRPPKPVPPAVPPALRAVGGAALATPALAVPAGAPRPPAVTAASWVVADLDTGAVLGACGAHQPSPPASVQKWLLAATVLPRLDRRQAVTVTPGDLAIEAGSSAVGLLLGGRYTVDLLWLGLLLNSGNDAANALARVAGGPAGVAGTIEAMNAEARRLGAYQTRAVTPSGLDGPGQFTSAYDVALIARACFAMPAFRRYVATGRAQVPAQPPKDKRGFQIQNNNRLLTRYPGALGGKTGFTDEARHTYVGVAQRGGRRLVVALLGAESRPVRGWQQGAALLDWGFRQRPGAGVGRLVAPGEPVPGAEATRAPAGSGRPPAVRTAEARAGKGGLGWPAGAAGVAALLVLTPVLVFSTRRRGGGRGRVG